MSVEYIHFQLWRYSEGDESGLHSAVAALEELTPAVAPPNELATLHLKVGLAAETVRAYPRCVEIYTRGYELADEEPLWQELGFRLARAMDRVGNWREAYALLEDLAAGLGSRSDAIATGIRFHLATYHHAAEEYAQARQLLEQIDNWTGDDPLPSQVTLLLAKCYLKLRQFAELERLLHGVDLPEAQELLGDAYCRQNRKEEARQVYESLLARGYGGDQFRLGIQYRLAEL